VWQDNIALCNWKESEHLHKTLSGILPVTGDWRVSWLTLQDNTFLLSCRVTKREKKDVSLNVSGLVSFSTVGFVSVTGLSPDNTQVTLTALGRKPCDVHLAIREVGCCSTIDPMGVTVGKDGLTASKHSRYYIPKINAITKGLQWRPHILKITSTYI